MNSLENVPQIEKPSQERRELFHAIDRGVRWEQIPVEEAIAALVALKAKYIEDIPNKLEVFFNLLDEIDAGVDIGAIPESEEIAALQRLKEKYPEK